MAEEIYGSFTKFGARSYLVMNRVSGYCTPIHVTNRQSNESHAAPPSFGYDSVTHHLELDASAITKQQKEELTITANNLATDVRMDVISSIACYCDIQFSNKEFLTAIKYPYHPFAQRFEELIIAIEEMQKTS